MGNKTSKEQSNENSRSPPPEEDKPSYWAMMKQGYQELVNAIIRPPRCQYRVSSLGPTTFEFCGRRIQRRDFELRNPRGLKIACSHWEPTDEFRPSSTLPCVVYMHGNSSARPEAISQLSLVLSLGATLLAFDFAGSGLSEGEYVSLGAFEKDDLQTVIDHLREPSSRVSFISLWGRSMGAATALLHGERDPSIASMILDSSFCDLTTLAEEMVDRGREKGLFAPGFVVSLGMRAIRNSVKQTAGFDVKDLCPMDYGKKCFIPALFVCGEGDEFIPPHHTHRIFNEYSGDKNVVLVSGGHNSPRPLFLFDSVAIFLQTTMQIPDSYLLPDAQALLLSPPWLGSNLYRASSNRGLSPPSLLPNTLPSPQDFPYPSDQDMEGFEVDRRSEEEDEEMLIQRAISLSLQPQQRTAQPSDSVDSGSSDLGHENPVRGDLDYGYGSTAYEHQQVQGTLERLMLGTTAQSYSSSSYSSSSSPSSSTSLPLPPHLHLSPSPLTSLSLGVSESEQGSTLLPPSPPPPPPSDCEEWKCTSCTVMNSTPLPPPSSPQSCSLCGAIRT